MEEMGRQILESGLVRKLEVPDLTLLPGSGGSMPPASEGFSVRSKFFVAFRSVEKDETSLKLSL